jgi:hypothetical protein
LSRSIWRAGGVCAEVCAVAIPIPIRTAKRLASFPRLHPLTKSGLSSAHVCFCDLRAMACVILRVQTIVLMLSRLYNSNLSAALTMQIIESKPHQP